ncbi:OmpA family protein [Granulicella sp. dw_53]|uniref:OmpA family protein n=1 Tax=Granulicella sp. dw_53 TaxID=2719792 RepID=UPI001BD29B0C|nr:OmpA family protein [Granulicella sp. dw_53]
MTNITKSRNALGLSVFVLGSAMGVSALAQTSAPASQSSQADPAAASSSTMNPDDKATYATGKPLEMQSKEGFWGRLNPLARKKWVNRQTAPLKDRANELDQLQAKNANDIRDVDGRAQAGIKNAMEAANTADQHAQDAATRASAANQLAGNASDRTTALNGTVANLDQYQPVVSESVPFASGRTTLGKTAKADLDSVADKLAGEKGYIIEVQGYSRAGVQTSQAMADSVVRYLVTEHQVPVYRIYRTGLGKNTAKATDGEKVIVNGVRVTLLHNSLATMGTTTASNNPSSMPATSSATTGVSAPPANQ